jgi:ribosomal protein L11 methyltransferase
MRWLELTISAHREAVEAISELLSRVAPGGVAIEEPIALLDDGQEYRLLPDGAVLVRAYLPLDGSEAEKRQQVEQGLWHLGQISPNYVGDLTTRQVAEEDWANAWKEYYHVLHLGQRIVIKPSWREYTPKPDEVVLELDPGMAFGTGLHPTTHMCLELLEQRVQPGMRVLDVGTGSGILALAAAKLGAASVQALDVSSVAVEAAQANVRANGLDERISVRLGSIEEASGERYDLVVANIIARVIADLAPALVGALASGGLLIASGIIDERMLLAEDALLAAGLAEIEQVRDGDWVSLMGSSTASGTSRAG